MGKPRLGYQFYRAAAGRFREGVDNHSVNKKRESGGGALVTSYGRYNDLLKFSDGFCRWLIESGIRRTFLADITVEDWNRFIEEKSEHISWHSLNAYLSNIRTWERIVNAFYGVDVNWSAFLIKPCKLRDEHKDILRIQQMSREDYGRIIEHANRPGSTSRAPVALELSARLGLRVEGAEKIRAKNIRADDGGVWGFGTADITEKGGRRRVIDIKSRDDRNYLMKLTRDKEKEQPIVGICKGSINKYINRVMDYLGIKEKYPETSMHSVRKMYAQETWDNYRNHGHSYDEALRYVNAQIGHGEERNKILLKVYVKNMW